LGDAMTPRVKGASLGAIIALAAGVCVCLVSSFARGIIIGPFGALAIAFTGARHLEDFPADRR
jgi:hypothetical protein